MWTREKEDRWCELAEDPEFHTKEEREEFFELTMERNDFVDKSLVLLGE